LTFKTIDPSAIGSNTSWSAELTRAATTANYWRDKALFTPVTEDQKELLTTLANNLGGSENNYEFIDEAVSTETESIKIDYEKMLQALFLSAEVHPHEINAYSKMLRSILNHDNPTQAKQKLLLEINKHPENPYLLQVFIDTSLIQFNQDFDVGKMKEDIELAAAIAPESGIAEMLESFIANAKQNFAHQRQLIDAAYEKNPNFADAAVAKSSLNLAQRNVSGAKQFAEEALLLAPNVRGAHQMLSAIASLQGNPNLAYEEAKRESVVDFGDPAGTYALSYAALNAGDLDTALAYAVAYNKAVPNDHSIGILIANIFLLKGDLLTTTTIARSLSSQAFVPAQIREGAHVLLSQVYIAEGNLSNARLQAEKALDINPEDISALSMLVNIETLDANYAKALMQAQQIANNFPQVSHSWSQLAVTQMSIGLYDAAQTNSSTALSLNPQDPSALYLKIFFMIRNGDTIQAAEELQNMKAKFGTLTWFKELEVSINRFMGDNDGALKAAITSPP